jgi:hypothetical protein
MYTVGSDIHIVDDVNSWKVQIYHLLNNNINEIFLAKFPVNIPNDHPCNRNTAWLICH